MSNPRTIDGQPYTIEGPIESFEPDVPVVQVTSDAAIGHAPQPIVDLTPARIYGPTIDLTPVAPAAVIEVDAAPAHAEAEVVSPATDIRRAWDELVEQSAIRAAAAAEILVRGAPDEVVTDFLQARGRGDRTAAAELVNRVLIRQGELPTFGAHRTLNRLLRRLAPNATITSVIHGTTSTGAVVISRRTDTVTIGDVAISFAVDGQFVVSEGHVAAWCDEISFGDLAGAVVRGVVAAAKAARLRERLQAVKLRTRRA